MFINFGNMFGESYDVIFEQYIGTALIDSHRANMQRQFIINQFMQLVQQMSALKEPRKLKLIRYEDIWDKFDGAMKQVEYSIEYQNWEDK